MTFDIFTDGACINNGKSYAKAGCGVYFPNNESKNISQQFTIAPITNQRAELYAILLALQQINQLSISNNQINIYSDSLYSINCLTIWVENWIKNGWKSKNNKPVKNVDIIKNIINLLNKYKNIKFFHVKAHTGKQDYLSIGNDMADKLATSSIHNQNNNQNDNRKILIEKNIEYDNFFLPNIININKQNKELIINFDNLLNKNKYKYNFFKKYT